MTYKNQTMKLLRHIVLLTALFSIILSCHNYNRILFSKADRTQNDEQNSVVKNPSRNTENDLNTVVLGDEVISSDSIDADKVSKEFSAALAHPSEKKKIERLNSILEKEKALVHELEHEIFGDKKKKTEFLDRKAKAEGDGDNSIKIFLIMLLVFLLLTAAIVLLIIWAIKTTTESAEKSCYVATMAYGDNDAPEVQTLRTYRDQYLRKSLLGMAFINFYYTYSPAFVERHRSKTWLHKAIKRVLNVFVSVIRKVHKLD
jgi:hypothetical protein